MRCTGHLHIDTFMDAGLGLPHTQALCSDASCWGQEKGEGVGWVHPHPCCRLSQARSRLALRQVYKKYWL